jgi:DNA ligase-1
VSEFPSPTAPLQFADLARASARLASTRSRLEKRAILVDALAHAPAEEIAAAVGWLVAAPQCGPLGVGPAHLWKLAETPAAEVSSVRLRDVEAALGPAQRGNRDETLAGVAALFARLTEAERVLFVGALTGSLRQGSLAGVMTQVIATLASRTEAEARRAVLVTGSIAAAADALLGPRRSPAPLSALELFRPLAPMLALHADSIDEALAEIADAEVEWKVDGLRAQIHKRGERVAIYSRQGNEITGGCAPLLDALRGLAAETAVLDGEVVRVGPDGEARAFQDTFSAIASKGALPPGDHLRVCLFDCMHRDGVDLLDEPLSARLAALDAIAPEGLRLPRLRSPTPESAARFYADAQRAGHEGVMVKDLASPYGFGARGGAWRKVKPFVTVDLVVLAVEWGSGRRKGLLSNLHLGARRSDGTFCMVGKTFKGLTDATLRWQTERLRALATDGEGDGHVVHVRPELVVEIRFNDVQRSPRYPGGVALRFARVVRYREDKSSEDVEPIEALVARAPAGSATPAKTAKAAAEKKRQLSLFGE